NNLGALYRETGRSAEAMTSYKQGIEILEEVLKRDGWDATAKQFLRNGYWGRALTLTTLGRHKEAVADWDRALDLDTGQYQTFFRRKRAISLAAAGDHGRAMAEAGELAKVKSQ